MKLRSLLAVLPVERFRNPPPRVAVVRLTGVIGRLDPLRRGLSLGALAAVFERAFELPDLKAVALAVNSPGGSPVQSALIARRIRALAEEHEVPVFAFAEDVAASGGYWLLTAADEIYADASSIIGSIGVVTAGFGFPEALKRLGVERRVHVSGRHKAALDPFQPEQPEEIRHLKAIQENIHDAFRRQVRERRGDRLKASEDELFSGRFWDGVKALEIGLVDGLGDLRTVLRERFGKEVKLVVVEDGRPWWRRRFGLPGSSFGGRRDGDWAAQIIAAVEERLMWNRFGL
ncbi:MAG: S49 family peptidase [Rhodospirillales bacterium]